MHEAKQKTKRDRSTKQELDLAAAYDLLLQAYLRRRTRPDNGGEKRSRGLKTVDR